MIDDGDVEQRAEEFYNCGFDGFYEHKEKAVIFECVGRGFKLPPLSQIYVPSFLLRQHQNEIEDIRPSHHVLELVSSAEAPPQAYLNEQRTNELSSSQVDLPKSNEDLRSESSDHDVYISDEDGTTDEPDCRPALTGFRVQNSEVKASLPINLVCKAECSPSGNKVVAEIDPFKNSLNEREECVTSDDEIFSNPSCGEDSGSDNEEVSVATNNLNVTDSCKLNQNDSANNLDAAANKSVQNISVDEDLHVENTLVPKVGDSLQKTIYLSDHNDPSEGACLEENLGTEVDGRCESSSSNSYRDPVADMFSSDESEENFFVQHFRTFRAEKNLVLNSAEFPGLPGKQTKEEQNPQVKWQRTKSVQNPRVKRQPAQNPQVCELAKPAQNPQMKCQVGGLSESQLKIKNIAKMLLSNPTDASINIRSSNFEANQRPSQAELLVVENIPQNVNKEYLVNFLLQFGQIKDATLIPLPDKITAKVQYEAGVNLDWVIACLCENPIFGPESEILRCYRE